MKILIVGMTAQQSNPASHQRVANFTGYLRQAMRDQGYDTWWQNPEINMDLDSWDHVVVGVAPITSLGANRAYGALSIIERLWDSQKLTLLVDAPDPVKIEASLSAILDTPENLTKPFFSYRKEYTTATDPKTHLRLLKAVSLLRDGVWPQTVVPRLPWTTASTVDSQLPTGATSRLTMLGLDHYVFDDWDSEPAALKNPIWAFEPSSDGRWLRRQAVTWETKEIPRSSRTEADTHAINLLRSSSGCLIAPTRHSTWWNTRYAMSLAQGVPVFTNWQETAELGPAWSGLPGVFEYTPAGTRQEHAAAQREAYTTAIGPREDTLKLVEHMLLLQRKRATRKSKGAA